MKGVILAAGKGTRMYPLTKEFPKCMLPVAGKPILEWGITLFRDELNIRELIIIVGFEKNKIINYFGDGENFGVSIIYQEQDLDSVYGLGSALKLAKDFVNEDFVLLLGDNLYKGPYNEIVEKHREKNSMATIHIEEVTDPSRYGVVVQDDTNPDKIIDMLEKPKNPPSNKVITGFYVLNRDIFKVLDKTPLSDRGELELTDALAYYIKTDQIYGIQIDGWRKDLGYPIDLLDASRWFLNNNKASYINSDIDDSVIIIDPVYIGSGCDIKNSTIGPYATIGSNVKMLNTRMLHSVILDDVEILDKTLIDTVIDKENTIELNILPKIRNTENF